MTVFGVFFALSQLHFGPIALSSFRWDDTLDLLLLRGYASLIADLASIRAPRSSSQAPPSHLLHSALGYNVDSGPVRLHHTLALAIIVL